MRKTLTVLAAASSLAIAAVATPAAADGTRAWRGPVRGWAIGAITANVITPDYFPYYGGFYSYNGPNYYPGPYLRCWRWRYGYRYWVC